MSETNYPNISKELRRSLTPNFLGKLEREPNGFIKTIIIETFNSIVSARITNNLNSINTFKTLSIIYLGTLDKYITEYKRTIKEIDNKLKTINLSNDKKETIKETIEKGFKDNTIFSKDPNIENSNPNTLNAMDLCGYLYSLRYIKEISINSNNELIKMVKDFSYSSDGDRKRADRLTREGLSLISEYLNSHTPKNLTEDNNQDKDNILESDNLNSKYAKDTLKTRYEPTLNQLNNSLLSFYNIKVVTYNEREKKKFITSKIDNLVKERTNTLNNKARLKEIDNTLSTLYQELKDLNIVNITIRDHKGNTTINGTYKIANADNNQVEIFNGDGNTIIRHYKASNTYITQHSAEFLNTTPRTTKLLSEIINKAYRENRGQYKTSIVYFSREELETIYNDIRSNEIIKELKKDFIILRDIVITACYEDLIKDKSLLDSATYDSTNKRAVIKLSKEFLIAILKSYYHNIPKSLKSVKSEYNTIINEIYNAPKKCTIPYEEIGLKIGTPGLNYIEENLDRHYSKILTSKVEDFLNLKELNETNKIVRPKTPPKTKKEIKDTKIVFKHKKVS